MTLNLRETLPESAAASQSASGTMNVETAVLGRIGHLETRLATTPEEIAAAQTVRFNVFVREMGAVLPPESMRRGRDMDAFDAVCDHLLVLDRSLAGPAKEQIVGTYRLLRQEVARANTGFYSTSEFAISEMLARHPEKRFMELGRSCVLPQYRTRRTVELLWQGNWAYALEYGVDVMFGCASLQGVRPQAHALALSFLYHNCLTEGAWYVRARPELFNNMDLMPKEAVNTRQAVNAMPPLLKGYLRLGATVGDGAVVDKAFGTTDVMVVLPTAQISDRYINYYGADASRFAS
ncbi:MAG: GNAT family N-acetyltransferase [Pseudomonadota bacterium]